MSSLVPTSSLGRSIVSGQGRAISLAFSLYQNRSLHTDRQLLLCACLQVPRCGILLVIHGESLRVCLHAKLRRHRLLRCCKALQRPAVEVRAAKDERHGGP